MSIAFGLQLYSVRDELKRDFPGTLQKIAEIGYRNLELSIQHVENGLEKGGNIRASELRKLLEKHDLNVVSTHVEPLEKADLDEVIAYNREIGSAAVVCPIMTFKNNKQHVIEYAETLNRYGEKLRRNGLDFYFHNHFNEFQIFEGQTVLELLLEHTDKDFVKFEFDTYWALRGGVDPVAYLSKLGDRCDIIHQKDIPSSVKPINLFEIFDHAEELTMERMFNEVKVEDFAEIGEGVMDIKSILDAVREAGTVKYVFVEQDYTLKNQLDSVAISYNNLSGLLKPS